MKKLNQIAIAKELAELGYFTEKQAKGFEKRGNKGMLAEATLLKNLNIKDTFDNKQGADLTYRGIKIQFKYMGLGSSPSVTETKKRPDESKIEFVERILEKYDEVDEYWIYLDNDLDIKLNKIYKLDTKEFKELLLTQNIKDNRKIRLTGKRKIKKQYTTI